MALIVQVTIVQSSHDRNVHDDTSVMMVIIVIVVGGSSSSDSLLPLGRQTDFLSSTQLLLSPPALEAWRWRQRRTRVVEVLQLDCSASWCLDSHSAWIGVLYVVVVGLSQCLGCSDV